MPIAHRSPILGRLDRQRYVATVSQPNFTPLTFLAVFVTDSLQLAATVGGGNRVIFGPLPGYCCRGEVVFGSRKFYGSRKILFLFRVLGGVTPAPRCVPLSPTGGRALSRLLDTSGGVTMTSAGPSKNSRQEDNAGGSPETGDIWCAQSILCEHVREALIFLLYIFVYRFVHALF